MKITDTYTDEAPALATYSLLPIVQAFASKVDIEVKTCDISLAARVLAAFNLAPDEAAELARLVARAEANIVKLPNVSATVPQLKAAIAELQAAGFAVPDYPTDPEDRDVLPAFSAGQGSAVNRCSARATPTAEHPPRSSSTPGATHTRWIPGRPGRGRTSPP